MKAVILAGGLGKRLRPLTHRIPKPLLPLGGTTAIELAIKGLARHGVKEVFIASGYRAEQVEAHLGDGSRYGVELRYSVESEPLGTCGPLSLLREELDEPFLLMNGDVVTDLDFAAAYRFARRQEAELTVVTQEDVLSYRYGVVRTEGDDVVGIEEKPNLSNEVLTGIYVVSPAVFDLVPEGRSYGIDELIADLLERGRKVVRYAAEGYWRDIGDPESYRLAKGEVAAQFGLPAPAADDDSWSPLTRWPEVEQWLRSPWLIVGALFLLATLSHVLSHPVSYGETQTLMYAKQFAEPDFLPGDWYLSVSQPVRVPFQLLILPLIKVLPLDAVSPLARMLCYLCVTFGLGFLAYRLRIHAAFAFIALGFFLWIDQGLLPAQEWILKRAESKVIAYALVLLALQALLARRLRWAGALAGLATTFHILVGGWSSVALGLAMVVGREGSWRQRAEAALAWCVTGSAALYFVLSRLGEPSPEGFDAAWLWVHFRNPHYLLVSWWDFPPFKVATLVVLIAVLAAAPRLFPERAREFRLASFFALFTLAPFVLGLAVSPFPFASKVLQYYPFRVADTLVPLLGLLIIVPAFFRYVLPRAARLPVAGVLVVLITLGVTGQFLHDLDRLGEYPRGGYWGSTHKTKELYAICDWVQENTPRGSRMIVSPRINVIPYLCERPVVVTFRDVPSSAVDLEEWYQRLIDFNAGEVPNKQGYAAANEIDRTFNRMTERQYLELGKEYDGRYLLVYRRPNLALPRVYAHDRWAVYLLDPVSD
ncbi:MAG: NTP transferase domain-containing protein [Acidobacteria bacterium]|nr:NTP transferase domain-containing protein [Acidobacteriota bacterium]